MALNYLIVRRQLREMKVGSCLTFDQGDEEMRAFTRTLRKIISRTFDMYDLGHYETKVYKETGQLRVWRLSEKLR